MTGSLSAVNPWQYNNQFFDEGQVAFVEGKQLKDCPYDYLKYDDENDIRQEHYRQREWLAGWRDFFEKNGE